MKVVRLILVLMIAAAAFVVAAALLAATARPEPGPCNDTIIIELPPDDAGVRQTRPAPMCEAPEAAASLVLGGGATASGVGLAGYVLFARSSESSSRQLADTVS